MRRVHEAVAEASDLVRIEISQVALNCILEIARVNAGGRREHWAPIENVLEGLQLLEAQDIVIIHNVRPFCLRHEGSVRLFIEYVFLLQDVHQEIINDLWEPDPHLLHFLIDIANGSVPIMVQVAVNEHLFDLVQVAVVDTEGTNALFDFFLTLLAEFVGANELDNILHLLVFILTPWLEFRLHVFSVRLRALVVLFKGSIRVIEFQLWQLVLVRVY